MSSASTGISEQTLNQEGERVTSKDHDFDMFLEALYEKRYSTSIVFFDKIYIS